jgi:hypothetical protein
VGVGHLVARGSAEQAATAGGGCVPSWRSMADSLGSVRPAPGATGVESIAVRLCRQPVSEQPPVCDCTRDSDGVAAVIRHVHIYAVAVWLRLPLQICTSGFGGWRRVEAHLRSLSGQNRCAR